MAPDGSGPVRNLDLDSLAFAWRPFGVLIALLLAVPFAWRTQVRLGLICALCLLGYLLSVLAFAIWNESAEVSLVTLSPFWKPVAGQAERTLVASLEFFAPVVLSLAAGSWCMPGLRRAPRAKAANHAA
jgi:hypothetical protein